MRQRKVATLVVKDAQDPKTRKDIVAWLRKRAAHIERHGAKYMPRVTAGLTYLPGT